MIRAVKYTGTSKTIEFYSDFLPNLDLNPITAQLARATNENAVGQSIKALCLTNFTERFYHPEIGTNLNSMMFDMSDSMTLDRIKTTVEDTIKNGEPRALLQSVNVQLSPDEQAVSVQIYYSLVNVVGTFGVYFSIRVR